AHLGRGRRVAIVGALAHREWTDQAGERRQRWLVKASTVTFLDRPNGPGRGVERAPAADSVSSASVGDDRPLTASARGAAGAAMEDGRR
ncbi:MAG: single-stranded DNA-binding protein, partial [Acidimicrobiales bacterium]